MARPGQAIAAALSRIFLIIHPNGEQHLGTLPLSCLKAMGGMSHSIALRERLTLETTRKQ
jgi:hypothetical protein